MFHIVTWFYGLVEELLMSYLVFRTAVLSALEDLSHAKETGLIRAHFYL